MSQNEYLGFGDFTNEEGEPVFDEIISEKKTQTAKIERFKKSLVVLYPEGFPSQKNSKSDDENLPPNNVDDYTDYFGE